MMWHVRSVHEKRRDFKCEMCKKDYTQKSTLNLHMKKEHLNNFEGIPCSQCDKQFNTACDFEIHKNSVHDKSRDFKCHLCTKAYPRKSSLNSHLKIKHSSSTPLLSDYSGKHKK